MPHALGGSNHIEAFLEPSFHPSKVDATMFPGDAGHASGAAVAEHGTPAADTHAEMTVAPGVGHAPAGGHGAEAAHADTATEYTLMAVSVLLAFTGIGLATYFFRLRPDRAEAMQQSFAGVHRVLLNKYYVDELYDRAIVQPIKQTSTGLLWKVVDAGVIDGAVNGTGFVVRTGAAVMRLAQTGSVRVYAALLFVGVLVVLGSFFAR